MADAALFIGFGVAARARELQALETFNRGLQFFSDLQERGELESFEPVLLQPHGGDLSGFVLARGSREQLDRLQADEEFLRLSARGTLVVESFGVVRAFIGESLNAQIALYQEELQKQLES